MKPEWFEAASAALDAWETKNARKPRWILLSPAAYRQLTEHLTTTAWYSVDDIASRPRLLFGIPIVVDQTIDGVDFE